MKLKNIGVAGRGFSACATEEEGENLTAMLPLNSPRDVAWTLDP